MTYFIKPLIEQPLAADGSGLSRRRFIGAATAFATLAAVKAEGEGAGKQNPVQLPQLHKSATEAEEKMPEASLPADERVGYAVVGLGHLSLERILPAFGRSKYSKVTALVSGDRAKASKVAAQYDVPALKIYSYENYDQLASNSAVQAIYIVLPNNMHAEYVLRGAKAGKHILCEKPMATSVRDCERMISACEAAGVKLMIAYRQQYEPMNRHIAQMVRGGKLGAIRSIIASNSQNQGDPGQWRQKVALAGGGCLPDVGIYCLNAARFLSGEEPSEVSGMIHQPKDDPRFLEVEETCSFTLKFPSGLIATCNSGYGAHRSQFLRLEGDEAWVELSPAFAYSGLKLRLGKLADGLDQMSEPSIEEVDQFAAEMDHMSRCVRENLQPHTGGNEGLQDQKITEAIYKSARTGMAVKLAAPTRPTRGPEPS